MKTNIILFMVLLILVSVKTFAFEDVTTLEPFSCSDSTLTEEQCLDAELTDLVDIKAIANVKHKPNEKAE